jgi:hypothetical protein
MDESPRLIKVVWLDARTVAGWPEGADPMFENPPMCSVGYAMGERGKNTYMAMTWDPATDVFGDVSVIPTGCILAIIDLQENIPLTK